MNSQNKILVLTGVLWAIMLVIYPFFYSRATGAEILKQGDLIMAGLIFIVIAIGLRLSDKLFATLNYSWAILTLTWALAATFSRFFKNTKMEIFDAVYARAFFSVDEWWIIALLVASGVTTMYYLITNLKTTTIDLKRKGNQTLTGSSVAIPVLWCLTLNLMN